MAFLAPAVPVIASLISTVPTILQATKSDPGKKAAAAAEKDRNERLQKEFLATNRADRLRNRLSSGSGQGSILGGSSGATGQTEIGRNVLLGQ
jgi:hypothetical protein